LSRIALSDASTTGKGVHIYVFDAGVRTTHADFGGRAVPELDMNSGSPVECRGDLSCAPDNIGHGTHCAGTAAGGTLGVARGAFVRGVKVLSDYGINPWSWTFGALDWVASKGRRPAVISASLGAPALGDKAACKIAVDACVSAGITVVVAAGNSYADGCSSMPAFVPSALSVGSTDERNVRSTFSNAGACVDIWAPGTNIISMDFKSNTGTKSMSGTSMATPHVSGAAALLLENNPRKDPAWVKQSLDDRSLHNVVIGLTAGVDSNRFLYVGEAARPPTPAPAPTPPPPAPTPAVPTCPRNSSGPDKDDDCKCRNGYSCYQGGSRNCAFSNTPKYGSMSPRFFLVTCSDCECRGR